LSLSTKQWRDACLYLKQAVNLRPGPVLLDGRPRFLHNLSLRFRFLYRHQIILHADRDTTVRMTCSRAQIAVIEPET